MIKDIPELRVEDVGIAIGPRPDSAPEDELWDVFLLNLKEIPLQNVMVTSRAYGEIENEPRRSTVFRQYFEHVEALDVIHLEPIHKDLFVLSNEFWVSFGLVGELYDKKYIFVPGSFDPQFFMPIPFTDRRGVIIR